MLSDVTLKVSTTSSYRTAGTDTYIENLIIEDWADHKKLFLIWSCIGLEKTEKRRHFTTQSSKLVVDNKTTTKNKEQKKRKENKDRY